MDLMREQFVTGVSELVSLFLGRGDVIPHHAQLVNVFPDCGSGNAQFAANGLSGNRSAGTFEYLKNFEGSIEQDITVWILFFLKEAGRDLCRIPA